VPVKRHTSSVRPFSSDESNAQKRERYRRMPLNVGYRKM
jgi:hypothetical protein